MDSKLRVVNLYRASSKQQTEKIKKDNGMTEYDVPQQRNTLIPFVEQNPDWTLIKEFVDAYTTKSKSNLELNYGQGG